MRPATLIYVALLGEDVDVYRPVQAELRPDGTYELLGEVPDDEQWEFVPGTVVRTERKALSEGPRPVATTPIEVSPRF
jgi:hypothetical protein